jgi:hypothetical protein
LPNGAFHETAQRVARVVRGSRHASSSIPIATSNYASPVERPQTFPFTDVEDGDESVVLVRSVEGGIGLAVSKQSASDVEVFLPPAVADLIADALRDASRAATS